MFGQDEGVTMTTMNESTVRVSGGCSRIAVLLPQLPTGPGLPARWSKPTRYRTTPGTVPAPPVLRTEAFPVPTANTYYYVCAVAASSTRLSDAYAFDAKSIAADRHAATVAVFFASLAGLLAGRAHHRSDVRRGEVRWLPRGCVVFSCTGPTPDPSTSSTSGTTPLLVQQVPEQYVSLVVDE